MSGENSASTTPTARPATFRFSGADPTTENGVANGIAAGDGVATPGATGVGMPTGRPMPTPGTRPGDGSRSATGGLKPKTQPRRNPQRRTQSSHGTPSASSATTPTSVRRHVNSTTPKTRVVLSRNERDKAGTRAGHLRHARANLSQRGHSRKDRDRDRAPTNEKQHRPQESGSSRREEREHQSQCRSPAAPARATRTEEPARGEHPAKPTHPRSTRRAPIGWP